MSLALAAALAATLAGPPVDVRVSRTGETFVAEFKLPRSAPAWGFFRSAPARVGGQPWRPASWTVLTPGVQLVHRGRYDALVGTAGGPVPRTVRVRVTPFTGDLVSDYVPALRLGARGIALFDGHFALFSVSSPSGLDRLPVDLADTAVGDSGTRVRFASPSGSLRLAGDVTGYQAGDSAGTYGLFDVPAAIEQDGMTTVVDAGLPAWLAADIRTFTPRVLARYRRQLGAADGLRPTVLASWAGAERPGISLNGGVLKGLVLMRMSGRQVLTSDRQVRSAAHRFIAHESAHFWLGQALEYDRTADSWIMEGGADLLAIRTLAAEEPEFDARAALQRSLDGCLAATRRGALAGAGERGATQAWYDCGAVLSLAAERAAGGDFGAFVGRMIAVNPDNKISADEWLLLIDRAAPGRGLARLARPLIERPQPDPTGWTALLTAANIRFRLRPDRTPELL
ncbi:hypothetical protein OMW55_09180 [Sphingomonas sp. BN140010]|uniref:Peptidase M1 membrane alanine aminopeptidase domain-containing protein n=1 Tax=Sphingomonas arvum TaxID=2992113 RepID=A0ABT3JGB7_9SPHN|nr:hypothetical protein [Sphingomonas sp. BN140010]MCW3797974.1 hypothetical protein [Sphingomonas sp. BN140010]